MFLRSLEGLMELSFDLLVDVGHLLDQLGIPYCTNGGTTWSSPEQARATTDIEFTIDADAAHLESLARAMEVGFYISYDAMAEALVHRGAFSAVSVYCPYKIRFALVGSRKFDQEELRRARRQPVGIEGKGSIRLRSPEDSVLRMLESVQAEPEQSIRQWRNVSCLVAVMRHHLDEPYLRRWAAELGVSDLLVRALGESTKA